MMMLKRTRQTIKADNRSKNKLDFIILGRGAYVAQKRLEKANWAKLTRQRRPDRVFGGHLRCDGQLIGCVRSTIYHVRDREEAGCWETERTVVKVAAVRPGLILLSGGLIWLGRGALGQWACFWPALQCHGHRFPPPPHHHLQLDSLLASHSVVLWICFWISICQFNQYISNIETAALSIFNLKKSSDFLGPLSNLRQSRQQHNKQAGIWAQPLLTESCIENNKRRAGGFPQLEWLWPTSCLQAQVLRGVIQTTSNTSLTPD